MNWGKLAGREGQNAGLTGDEFREIASTIGAEPKHVMSICAVKERAAYYMLRPGSDYKIDERCGRLMLLEKLIKNGRVKFGG